MGEVLGGGEREDRRTRRTRVRRSPRRRAGQETPVGDCALGGSPAYASEMCADRSRNLCVEGREDIGRRQVAPDAHIHQRTIEGRTAISTLDTTPTASWPWCRVMGRGGGNEWNSS